MILDLQTMLSGTVAADGTKTGQAITATAISENVIDLRNYRTGVTTPVLVDEGIGGDNLYLVVQCSVAAAGGDAAKTLTITLDSDSTADLATSATTHFSSGAILGSALTAGATVVRTRLPSGSYERYLGLTYTVSAGFTSFKMLAYLTPNIDRNVIYPVGYSIDV